MRELRKAPEGQPTSNIKTMLVYAQKRYEESSLYVVDTERRLKAARESVNHWADEVAVLKWQLEQRESQEVNGL